MVISYLFFVNSNMRKLLYYLDEKKTEFDILYVRNIIFGSSGNPPYWNQTLDNTKFVGYAIKPLVLDYQKIYFNDLIIRNLSTYDKFYGLFTRLVSVPNVYYPVQKTIYWVAYFKIKSLNPLLFQEGYGPLSITRTKSSLIISFNLTNYTNPYFFIELVTDKPLIVSQEANASVVMESSYLYNDYKIWNNKSVGRIILNYSYQEIGNEKVYNYPTIMIIKKLDCNPESICENSGIIDSTLKIPLIKWFGMTQYKGIIDKKQAQEVIYNNFLRTSFDTFLVETHVFVWED
jgi:hypothetical protein